MDFGIQGKVALVLSAGGGLGRATAIGMANEGAALAVADLNECALEETLRQVKATGAHGISEAANLMDLPALKSFVARVVRELGEVDILVNISGGPPPTTAANVPPQTGFENFNPWSSR